MITTFLFQLIDQVTGEAYGSPQEFTSQEEADEYLQAHIESIIEENIEEDMEANPEAVNYYKETLAYEPAENVFCFL